MSQQTIGRYIQQALRKAIIVSASTLSTILDTLKKSCIKLSYYIRVSNKFQFKLKY